MIDNCLIHNKSFLDDISNLNSLLQQPLPVTRFSIVSELIASIPHNDDHWTPCIILASKNYVNTKMASNKGVISGYNDLPNTIGIQDFLIFNEPIFNSWNTTNCTLNSDWILNNIDSSYVPVGGLLFWFKKLKTPIYKNITEFPHNTRLVLANTFRIFIKLDNDTLYEINDKEKNSSKFIDEFIDFNYTTDSASSNYVSVNSLGENPLFTSDYTVLLQNPLIVNNNYYNLWITNGDVYSYYLNYDEYQAQNNIISPRSFCSSSLYQIYNNIYHQLTIDNIKTFNQRNTHVSRCYKNLAKYLSTSPYINEFAISRLSDSTVKEIVNTYIIDKNLFSCLIKIITYLKSLNIDIDKNTINQNLIKDHKSFKQKIIQKYGAKLVCNNDSTISFKQPLINGDNLVISQVGEYWLGKDIKNSIITANQTINIGQLSVKTKFGQDVSKIELISPYSINNPELLNRNNNPTEISFYDSIRPVIKQDPNNFLNLVMEKTTNNPELEEYYNNNLLNRISNVIFKYVDSSRAEQPVFLTDLIKFNVITTNFKLDFNRFAEDSFNPSDILARDDISCFWEQVSGPPLKFIDINKFYISPNQGPIINIGANSRDKSKIFDASNVEIGFSRLAGTSEVYVAPSITGRYQIKCTITTPFGTFNKIKTFYVVYGRNLTATVDKQIIGKMLSQQSIKEYEDVGFGSVFSTGSDRKDLVSPNPIDVNYILNREKFPIFLNNDNLRVHTPNLRKIAINSNGLFWPINTNLHIKPPNGKPVNLNNISLYQFQFYSKGNDSNSNLIINYSLGNFIQYKLERIILEKTRVSGDTSCSTCLSFYQPKLYGSNGNWTRWSSTGELGFSIDSFENNVYNLKNFTLPPISTDYSPSIKSYGGYDYNTVNSIGVIIPNHPQINESLPSITGQPLDYKSDNQSSDPPFYTDDSRKFCFEDILEQPNNYLSFSKGVFHPSKGWIPYNSTEFESNKNLSSVLKFNPGARDSFSFSGPSIKNLTNESYILENDNQTYIIPKIFKSIIDLSVSVGAQWIQWGQKCNETSKPGERTGSPPDWAWRNQIHREYTDQLTMNIGEYTNHGYRILEGGRPKWIEFNNQSNLPPVMDEFGFDINEYQNKFSYRFPTFGPHYPLDNIPSFVTDYWSELSKKDLNENNSEFTRDYGNIEDPKEKWKGLKNPRVLNFDVKDLEVKINFLNYINTKDLTIHFEAIFSPDEINRVNPPGRLPLESAIINNINFIDQTIPFDVDGGSKLFNSNNILLSRYIEDLNKTNTQYKNNIKDVSLPLKLYLLNQEYIQNHSYNLSLKFSDSANKFNILSDSQYSQKQYFISTQNIVSNNDTIKPSFTAINHSDREASLYHEIINSNKLNILNNTFSKYKGKSLFNNKPPCLSPESNTTESPNNNGVSSFSCIISIYDEHDDMLLNDNTINSQLFSNLEDFTSKLNTSKFNSNLCNWELLLHTQEVHQLSSSTSSSLHSYGNNEALSLIDYSRPPSYPGYNFIANLAGYKHLLPFVNLNAPNIFFQDYSLCEDPNSSKIGKSISSYNLEFPYMAIVQILDAISTSASIGVAGGLAGVSAGISVGNAIAGPAYAALRGYFDSVREQKFDQGVANDTHFQEYNGYPFGSPEKILINFSKDDVFWYKAEASIFKYQHTPILSNKEYNYIRLNQNSIPLLSRFNYDTVSSLQDLIDDRYIKSLSIKCSEFDKLNGEQTFDNITYFLEDIVDVSVEQDASFTCASGLYFVTNNNWINLENNPMFLHNNTNYILQNHIIFYEDYNILKNIKEDIINNKIIILNSKIPYDIFDINDIIYALGDNETVEVKILSKALIYKNNESYSLLKLDTNMSSFNSISPNNDVVVLFKASSSSDFTDNIVNMYGFEKDSLEKFLPEIINSTNSYGSYGDGSANINKKVLETCVSKFNINKLYHSFSNNFNDKLKYNNIIFSTTHIVEDKQIRAGEIHKEKDPLKDQVKGIGSSKCYFYNMQDIKKYIEKNQKYIISNNITENILQSLEDQLDIPHSLRNDLSPSNYHFLYVKNSNFKNISIVPSDKGYAKIENDYQIDTPIDIVDINNNIITDDIYNLLADRLNLLEYSGPKPELELLIGQSSQTNNIIASNHIKYISDHYETLTEYNTSKKNTEFALSVLYKERDDILKLLLETSYSQVVSVELTNDSIVEGKVIYENIEKITIENNNVNTTFSKEDIINITRKFLRKLNNIRPQKLAIVSQIRPFSTSSSVIYNIEYKNNTDDYWINLDPNQACSIAEELRPKVLTEITYICRPTNYQQTIFGTPILAENNICARNRGTSLDGASFDPSSVSFKKSTRTIRGEPYESYSYSMPIFNIQSKKSEIIAKARRAGLPIQWETKIIRRDYHINGKNEQDYYNNQEILVSVEEKYDILLAPHEINNGKTTDPKTKDADTLTIPENVPSLLEGWNPSRSPFDSPDGFGLLDGPQTGRYNDNRTNQSVKIYNICNLDNVNNLKVKIRKIPRQIRGLDLLSTIYRYGKFNTFQPFPRRSNADPLNPESASNAGAFGSPYHFPLINNNFYYWKCMEIKNNINSRDNLVLSSTPIFFQLMNEMAYRSFYGSVDRIENKYDQLVSQFLWELIPYEYFVKPKPPVKEN